ncbi:protein phosphatase 1 regulatory subunit 12C-like isoform X3 [Hordeum vulgare subsp. vulgare]|uniref:protein phosphatase 1 regulatory subunit 12C-like isoform X3 n=1 Tax=Hordeum vulgare subsp. vulgare TaxID=112509 RepID=UPI001D1A3BC4|nr:protein phosphatase 1 regulatory subunit 12C-like isoform X3 [Hordeum vulgare subsp. vulgare]
MAAASHVRALPRQRARPVAAGGQVHRSRAPRPRPRDQELECWGLGDFLVTIGGFQTKFLAPFLRIKIAKELDVQGHGIPVTVANTTYMGMNALHAAGALGRLPVYRYLVEEVKMDIHKPDTLIDFTPVEHALKHGRLPAVKYLLDHGANLHLQRGDSTLLHSAATRGQSEMPNKDGGLFGIIDVALHKPSVSCVKLLIQGGANVSGDNPLAKAAEKGLTEAIKCLLEAGADPNVVDRFGRLPIELAVEYGTREDVAILFPFTSPISTVANWSVDGIISHVQMEIKQLEDDNFVEKRISDLKQQAAEAFKKQDYLNASVFYTQALKMDNFDAKLLSNRSLCWLRMGDGERSYEDATECKKLQPKWAKAYYRQGAAQILMEDYDDAYHSLLRALELDPESQEIAELLLETIEVV